MNIASAASATSVPADSAALAAFPAAATTTGMPDYEYAVRGRFADISAAAYFSALNSLPLRRSWDSTIKDIQLLQLKQATQPLPPPCGDPAAAAHSTSSCGSERRAAEAEQELCVYPTAEVRGASGGPQVYPVGGPEYEELIYWRVGLPWPAKDRDFVFARRLRGYKTTTSNSSSNRLHALVCGQLQAESAEAPPSDEAVRVEAFEAAIVAFPDNAEPGGPLSFNAGGASSVAHGDPSLHPYGGPGGPRGGDPEANGVIYVALHYDRSRYELLKLLFGGGVRFQRAHGIQVEELGFGSYSKWSTVINSSRNCTSIVSSSSSLCMRVRAVLPFLPGCVLTLQPTRCLQL